MWRDSEAPSCSEREGLKTWEGEPRVMNWLSDRSSRSLVLNMGTVSSSSDTGLGILPIGVMGVLNECLVRDSVKASG